MVKVNDDQYRPFRHKMTVTGNNWLGQHNKAKRVQDTGSTQFGSKSGEQKLQNLDNRQSSESCCTHKRSGQMPNGHKQIQQAQFETDTACFTNPCIV